MQLYRLWVTYPRPATLQCDNGGEFKAAVASAADLFGIRIVNSSVGNPQAQGAVERTNRSFKDMVRALLLECPTVYWSFQVTGLKALAAAITWQYNDDKPCWVCVYAQECMLPSAFAPARKRLFIIQQHRSLSHPPAAVPYR